jgi:hypothetical protein
LLEPDTVNLQAVRHTANITVIFTGLVGTAINHIIDLFPIYIWVTLHERFNRHSAKVIGTDRCKATGITANGRMDGIDDISVFILFPLLPGLFSHSP